MESVYFCNKVIEKDVLDILKEDEFMRVSYVIRESDTLYGGKKGCILYMNASQEETSSIEQKLKDIGTEKVTGDEEKAIIETFKAEEENAASGMGMIFG